MDSTLTQWLSELVTALDQALTEPDAPRGDLEWLLLRAHDTTRMSGDLAERSVLDLAKSIAADLRGYPTDIPKALLRSATSIPGTQLPFALLQTEAFALGLPGAPRWTSVTITGPLTLSGSSRLRLTRDDLASPESFAQRFAQLLSVGYPWINLGAAGLRQDCLLVSVELPDHTDARVTIPSINASGPTALVQQRPGWPLDDFIDFDDARGSWPST